MDLFEASKFYGDFRLAVQILADEHPEIFEDTQVPEEFLSCSSELSDL